MINTMKDGSVTSVHPVADGAVGVAGEQPEKTHWFVAVVNSRHEKTVSARLIDDGFTSYVATQKEMRVWQNGRRKIIDRVVIPSVVFIKCTERERRKIVALPYILRFMVNRAVDSRNLNRPVAVISDAEIEKLRFMLGQSETPVNFEPTIYKVRDNVRVIRGHLKGLEGEIMKNSDGTHTLTVGLTLLGGATVLINPLDVEKI